MTAPLLIGLRGPSGVGKTAIAKAVVNLAPATTLISSFARPIKVALYGGSIDKADDPLLYRRAAQAMGEAIRATDPHWFVRRWAERVRGVRPQIQTVVVDDVRFENEAEAVRSLGGHIVYLSRSDRESWMLPEPERSHESEVWNGPYRHMLVPNSPPLRNMVELEAPRDGVWNDLVYNNTTPEAAARRILAMVGKEAA